MNRVGWLRVWLVASAVALGIGYLLVFNAALPDLQRRQDRALERVVEAVVSKVRGYAGAADPSEIVLDWRQAYRNCLPSLARLDQAAVRKIEAACLAPIEPKILSMVRSGYPPEGAQYFWLLEQNEIEWRFMALAPALLLKVVLPWLAVSLVALWLLDGFGKVRPRPRVPSMQMLAALAPWQWLALAGVATIAVCGMGYGMMGGVERQDRYAAEERVLSGVAITRYFAAREQATSGEDSHITALRAEWDQCLGGRATRNVMLDVFFDPNNPVHVAQKECDAKISKKIYFANYRLTEPDMLAAKVAEAWQEHWQPYILAPFLNKIVAPWCAFLLAAFVLILSIRSHRASHKIG